MRMHPDEKTLRTVSELTPALRELVARMARSAAKDAVQEVMDDQNLIYDPAVDDRATHESGAHCDNDRCTVCGDQG